MRTPNQQNSRVGHYVSDRVYEGVRAISNADAKANRVAVISAFKHMLDQLELVESERVVAA